jgi:L-threonylcarbamoyladenylate synthase
VTLHIRQAVDVLLVGGVIAYPTEGVFGLGCRADDTGALRRLLAIKGRDHDKGFILLAAQREQLDGWVAAADLAKIPQPQAQAPTTWIANPGVLVTPLLRGANSGIAVRLTTNPVAHAICTAFGLPITSTSANFSGRPVARNRFQLRRNFASLVDYIVPGDCGPAQGPSEIRVLENGRVIRPAKR